jgi:hypothetical protein
VVVALAGNAVADDHAVEAARAHYQAGKAYYAAGELRRALTEFAAASGDADRPELEYNIGLCYERLGDAARAAASYQRYIDRAAPGEEVNALKARLPALLARTGKLSIVTRVPGAVMQLDDERLAPALLSAPITVTAGAHVLRASKEGMFTHTEAVQVIAGQATEVEIDPRSSARTARRHLPGWAIGLITTGCLLVAGGVTAGAVVGTRHGNGDYVGNTGAGLVKIAP